MSNVNSAYVSRRQPLQTIWCYLSHPMSIALLLSCASTFLKTAAWYGQTIIPDESLLTTEWPQHDSKHRCI